MNMRSITKNDALTGGLIALSMASACGLDNNQVDTKAVQQITDDTRSLLYPKGSPSPEGLDGAIADVVDGGNKNPDCLAWVKVLSEPKNVSISKCTADTVEAKITSPTKIQLNDKTIEYSYGSGDFTFVYPNLLWLRGVTDHYISEPKESKNRLMREDYGIQLGFAPAENIDDGVEAFTYIPDNLNSHKSEGKVNVVAFKTIKGRQFEYKCDVKDAEECSIENVNVDVPQETWVPGKTFYVDLVNTPIVNDETPPLISLDSDKDGGCSISEKSKETSSSKSGFLATATAAVAVAMARRKKRK